MEFKVGDRVRYKHQDPADNVEVGEVGTICGISEVTGNYGVAFETKDVYKHSCGGLCCDNHGWWCSGDTLEPVDSKPLRMADGTIIGEFNTGGVVSIHDLPTSEWYNPMRLTFKNGSSIEALPQKDDAIRGKNHFCDGFIGGKIPNDLIVSHTEMERPMDRLLKALENPSVKFGIKKLERKLKEEKNLKFTFYVTEGTRPDKSPDGDGKGVIPTMTTEVIYKDNDGCANGGSATCDKADYNERQGCLEAIANAVLGGNFDREYEKFLADKKHKYDESCKCKICGCKYYEDEKTGKRTPFTPEDARKHEEWHEQNKKNKREKYLIRKEAKRRLAEAEREGKIEQTMKELYKK